MKTILLVFVLACGFSVGHCQSAAFFLCVTNTQFHYLDLGPSTLTLFEPSPVPNEKASEEERRRLLELQKSRTQTEILQARADANELDIFIFKSLLGSAFNDTNPNLLNVLRLSQNICGEANAVVTKEKAEFLRTRPFVGHPEFRIQVDPKTVNSPSYPSGHSMISYLEALVLCDILPEKRTEILKRADEFGHERNLLGVHYFSDVAAGHTVAIAIHDQLVRLPAYQQDLQAASRDMASFKPQDY